MEIKSENRDRCLAYRIVTGDSIIYACVGKMSYVLDLEMNSSMIFKADHYVYNLLYVAV